MKWPLKLILSLWRHMSPLHNIYPSFVGLRHGFETLELWNHFTTLFSYLYFISFSLFLFLVNNFQSIRNDLFDEVKGHVETRKIAQNAEKFNEELIRQDQKLKARYKPLIQLNSSLCTCSLSPIIPFKQM